MRSDAKASSAGTNQRRGRSVLGSFFRGALAARASSGRGPGRGAPSARRLALPTAVLAAIVAVLVLLAGLADAATSAITEPATNIAGTHATLNGTVNPEGVEPEECLFEWGEGFSGAYTETVACAETPAEIGSGTSPVPVHADITGLKPQGVYYHFRLAVVNSPSETLFGSNKYFRTLYTVVTEPATSVGETSATLNGTVNPEGVELEECFFEYGKTTAYGEIQACAETPAEIGTGTSAQPVHADVSGLELGAEYHFRLVAVNENGAVEGGDQHFKLESPPVIDAQWAESVVLSEATLHAEINPEGFATTYKLEYGTNTSYGHETAESSVGSDSADHLVTDYLSGLQAGTVYHYRFVATNAIGTRDGEDQTFTTYAPRVLDTSCPNQRYRTGEGAKLPDCRAYEMVSPINKGGSGIDAPAETYWGTPGALQQSAVSGDKVAYGSKLPFGDAASNPSGSQYIATRQAGQSWTTHSLNPPQTHLVFSIFPAGATMFKAFTPDLCGAWLRTTNDPPLAEGAIEGVSNLYRRDNCGERADTYEAVTTTEPPHIRHGANGGYGNLELQGVSADGADAVYIAPDTLPGTDAPPQTKSTCLSNGTGCELRLYEHSPSGLSYVCILPNGEATAPCTAGGGLPEGQGHDVTLDGDVSESGQWVFWTDQAGNRTTEPEGPIYLRQHPEQGAVGGECSGASVACTIRVSEEGEAMSGTSKSLYWAASPDGSVVLYTTGGDLYEARIGEESGHPVVSETNRIARQLVAPQEVAGWSEDLSHVYFLSKEAIAGAGENGQGDEAEAGRPNLYLYDRGVGFSFVVTMPAVSTTEYPRIGSYKSIGRESRVTPDGGTIVFPSSDPLTGYDNTDQVSGEADMELFVYHADSGRLSCVSCNPSGARPQGERGRPDLRSGGGTYWMAAYLPVRLNDLYEGRPMSADGTRIFFNSYDPLDPKDGNGKIDVYEWEAPGSGTCSSSSTDYSARNGGCIYLISTGKSDEDATFLDADPSGSNAFFLTASSLVSKDPGLVDVYDARVGGGLPQPVRGAECEGEACQSPPPAPTVQTPASSSFRGYGNAGSARKLGCSGTARRAQRLSRRAKGLRRHAKFVTRRTHNQGRAKRLRRRARRLAKSAHRLSTSAKRCRRRARHNRRAAR